MFFLNELVIDDVIWRLFIVRNIFWAIPLTPLCFIRRRAIQD